MRSHLGIAAADGADAAATDAADAAADGADAAADGADAAADGADARLHQLRRKFEARRAARRLLFRLSLALVLRGLRPKAEELLVQASQGAGRDEALAPRPGEAAEAQKGEDLPPFSEQPDDRRADVMARRWQGQLHQSVEEPQHGGRRRLERLGQRVRRDVRNTGVHLVEGLAPKGLRLQLGQEATHGWGGCASASECATSEGAGGLRVRRGRDRSAPRVSVKCIAAGRHVDNARRSSN